MVREPDATMQPTPQDSQLMSQHRILSLKSQLRIEWRDQDGQTETEQPDHSTSLGDSVTSSTRMRFSAHTTIMGRARTYRWTRMRPYRARFRGQGVFFAFQSWAGCITNIFGFDLRKAQGSLAFSAGRSRAAGRLMAP